MFYKNWIITKHLRLIWQNELSNTKFKIASKSSTWWSWIKYKITCHKRVVLVLKKKTKFLEAYQLIRLKTLTLSNWKVIVFIYFH